jgi:hypothetical protein
LCHGTDRRFWASEAVSCGSDRTARGGPEVRVTGGSVGWMVSDWAWRARSLGWSALAGVGAMAVGC